MVALRSLSLTKMAPTFHSFTKVVPLAVPSLLWMLAQSFVPKLLGRRVPWGPVWTLGHVWDEVSLTVTHCLHALSLVPHRYID